MFELPSVNRHAHKCPRCGVTQAPKWDETICFNFQWDYEVERPESLSNVTACECAACGGEYLMVMNNDTDQAVLPWPIRLRADLPEPQQEVPDELRALYEEAAAVSLLSPRAGAALARLCMESVVKEMVPLTDKERESGRRRRLYDLLQDMEINPPRGVSAELGEDLHNVRKVGNVSVHEDPGTIVVNLESEDPIWMLEVVRELFELRYVVPARKGARDARTNKLHKQDPDA